MVSEPVKPFRPVSCESAMFLYLVIICKLCVLMFRLRDSGGSSGMEVYDVSETRNHDADMVNLYKIL